ncbi:MAG TPA: hypothetical protein VNW95_15015 [Mucilaginibacter sp.]|jgi:hypothetical protein|nr:hypothetical protein [Mucilaginibacter sp.]
MEVNKWFSALCVSALLVAAGASCYGQDTTIHASKIIIADTPGKKPTANAKPFYLHYTEGYADAPAPARLQAPAAPKILQVRSVGVLSTPSPSIKLPNLSSKGLANQVGGATGQLLKMPGALADKAFGTFKSVNDAVAKNFKALQKPSFSANLTLENDLQYNPVLLVPQGTGFQNVLGVKGSLMILGIPLNLNISNNQAAFNGQNPFGGSLYKLGFSPNMFAGILRNQLQQYTDLKNSAFNGFYFTEYVRQTALEQVQSLEQSAGNLKNTSLSQIINNPEALQGLIGLNQTALTQKLHDLAVQKTALAADSSGGQSVRLSDGEKQANLRRADSLAQVITNIKSQLAAKGLDPQKLIVEENYLTGKTSSSFNSSEALSTLSDKKPTNSLQSLLSGIKDLRLGSFGTTLPGASGEQSKLMDGANLTVKLGYYPLTVGFGKLDDLNSLKDASYNSSVYVYPQNVSYVGAEMPRSVFGNVKVSVISSYSAQSNNAQYAVPTLPGSAVMFMVSKAMNLPGFGHFSVDVSKSNTLFDNSSQPGSEAILVQKSGANLNTAVNLFQSFAVGFRHSLDIRELNASDNVYFNYSGMGYQNPANNGYAGGALKFGGTVKKKFYKNKLTFDLRTDYSNTPLSYVTNDKWKNYQVQLDSKYQVSNHFNFSLKYLASGTEKATSGTLSSVYDSKKFEVDANNTYKIGKYTTTSRISIANQTFTNTYLSAAGSNLWNFSYLQSIVFKSSSLTGTLFYNKEMATSQLLGDMLTSEVIYQYQFLKKIQLSSGLSYLSNASVAKQAGFKQSVQLMAGKHYDVSASFNYMKNMITPQYAELFPAYRGDLAIKYYFKLN